MASNTEKLVVELDANITGYISAMKKAKNETDKATKQISKDLESLTKVVKRMEAGFDKSTKAIKKDLDSTTGGIKKFNLSSIAAGVSVGLLTNQIKNLADSYTSIQNQIRQTTNSQEELEQVTNSLLEVSNRSRTEFAATSELYTQLTLSTQEMNLSNEELLRLTETIGKSFAVSGKTAAESSGAIRQLGQAFSAGALRGDEFNSIAEGAPEIMRALQRELKLSAGELRAFAATGGITAEILVDSLGSAADVIDTKMDKAVKTFAQSAQEANNNLIKFIGSSTTIANIIGGAGDALVTASNNVDNLAKAATLLAAVIAAKNIPTVLAYTTALAANTRAQLLAGTTATRTANVYGVVSVAQASATVTTNALTLATRALSASMAFLGGPVGIALIAATALFTFSDEILSVFDNSKKATNQIDEFTKSIEGLTQATKAKMLGDINIEMQALRAELSFASGELDRFKGLGESATKSNLTAQYLEDVERINAELTILSEKQGALIGAPDLSGGTKREVTTREDAENQIPLELAYQATLAAIKDDARLSDEDRLGAEVAAHAAALEAKLIGEKEFNEKTLELAQNAAMSQKEIQDLALEERNIAEFMFIDAMSELNDLKTETLEEQLTKELEIQKAMLESGLIDEKQFMASQAQSAQKFSKSKIDGDKKQAKTEKELMDQGLKFLTQNSRAAFNINKALDLASAITGTAKGVAQALPNFPLAAAVGIAGAGEIAAIASTEFGGGGGRSSSSVSAPAAASESVNGVGDDTSNADNLDVNVQDISASGSSSDLALINVTGGDTGDQLIADWYNESIRSGRIGGIR